MKNKKQKILSVLFVLSTIPCVVLERDATATVFALMIGIPMFFSKRRWLY